MNIVQVDVSCTKCKFNINQEIDISIQTNSIYCPVCNNIFDFNITDHVHADGEYEEDDLVVKNLAKAYEEIPHTFIRTEAIFMKGYINGVEVNFLMDTGAEMSLLPLNLVEACGLTKILDRKYQGQLSGVGHDKIEGKLHYVEVVLDCGVYPCAFTVCANNNLPPILGIDMMYNLGINIDFKKSKIVFNDTCSIDFIKKSHTITPKQSPLTGITVSSPNNK
jgi:DNA damage-inducible protein 1